MQYQNIANARIHGAELEMNYDWGGGFAIVTATHTSGEDVDTGLGLTTIPPDRISGTIGIRWLNGRLITGARTHLVDASRLRTRGGVDGLTSVFSPTDGYVLWDLFGSYQFNDWSALDVALNNITDVDYRKYLDQDDSAGFQARAALTVKFGGSSTGPLSDW